MENKIEDYIKVLEKRAKEYQEEFEKRINEIECGNSVGKLNTIQPIIDELKQLLTLNKQ